MKAILLFILNVVTASQYPFNVIFFPAFCKDGFNLSQTLPPSLDNMLENIFSIYGPSRVAHSYRGRMLLKGKKNGKGRTKKENGSRCMNGELIEVVLENYPVFI